jgi:putative membrane protein
MNIIVNWLVSAMVIFVVAYLLPGVHVEGFVTALAVAIVLGVMNAVIKPILFVLTLPVTLLTLGLFTFVINAFLILLTDAIVPGFKVDGFWWALLYSILISLVTSILRQYEKQQTVPHHRFKKHL